MNWTAITRMCCVASMCGTWAVAEGRTPDEVRDILEDVLSTEYCGTAIANGLGVGSALKGLSPVEGRGFITVAEEEWRPVLLKMAEDELCRCLENAKTLAADIRRAQQEIAQCIETHGTQEERERLNGVRFRTSRVLDEVTESLQNMLPLLGRAEGGGDEVDLFLERVVHECPPEASAFLTAVRAGVRRTLRRQNATRCLELGSWIRDTWGIESDEHWDFCLSLLISWNLCENELGQGTVVRYLLNTIEQANSYKFCNGFDMYAEEELVGWKGSLQRRRLAERFRNEPARGGCLLWNAEKREYEFTEPTERDIALMLWSRAAAELAANESELTDLREVYGDWAQKAEEE